eukprot:TRINITY_DN722_c0_g1_i1.p1 TRINITY_DN722_c0_g1~~TRINITY_DN722_c0_g1_i1.p1  ORF type:complete len:299 (+),score=39.48 TRINITY_DN722_c0_g1_i1:137-1033(+)
MYTVKIEPAHLVEQKINLAPLPVSHQSLQLPKEGLFRLHVQPKEKQRKSYNNENRFISPSPLVVVPCNPNLVRSTISDGFVQAKIVSEDGTELLDDEDTIMAGNRIAVLDESMQAQFQLKLLQGKEKRFRLRFTVQCHLAATGMVFQEVFYSLPFHVKATSKQILRPPSIYNMHTRCGYCDRENEVWIKGRNFSDRSTMEVYFGTKQAKILETDENLLICLTPIEDVEPNKEKAVEVRVRNIHPTRGPLESENHLTFIFLGPQIHSIDHTVVDLMMKGIDEQAPWHNDVSMFNNHFPS